MAGDITEEKVQGLILSKNGVVTIDTILSEGFQERPPYFNLDQKSMGYIFLDGLLKEIYATYSIVYDRDGLTDEAGNKITKNPVIGVRFKDQNGADVTVQVDLINGRLWRNSSPISTPEGVKALAQEITQKPAQPGVLKA